MVANTGNVKPTMADVVFDPENEALRVRCRIIHAKKEHKKGKNRSGVDSYVVMYKLGDGTEMSVARVILGLPKSKKGNHLMALTADHLDGDRLNNRKKNLEAVTGAENIRRYNERKATNGDATTV